jgi:hypothetical protein
LIYGEENFFSPRKIFFLCKQRAMFILCKDRATLIHCKQRANLHGTTIAPHGYTLHGTGIAGASRVPRGAPPTPFSKKIS